MTPTFGHSESTKASTGAPLKHSFPSERSTIQFEHLTTMEKAKISRSNLRPYQNSSNTFSESFYTATLDCLQCSRAGAGFPRMLCAAVAGSSSAMVKHFSHARAAGLH